MTAPVLKPQTKLGGSPVSDYARQTMHRYNGGTLIDAADAWVELLDQGGQMFLAIAGAASTARLGIVIAELIRQDKICGISCTGANLEEDVFNLVGLDSYVQIPDYSDKGAKDDEQLAKRGLNRVTDAAIPDDVAELVTDAILVEWQKADQAGTSDFRHQFMYRVLLSGALEDKYQVDPSESWVLAAAEKDLPIIVPGSEDSTLGNAFQGYCLKGYIKNPDVERSGNQYMIWLAGWYAAQTKRTGFFQLGGGIAGDCPICVVPLLRLDLKREDVEKWAYFCQITDAHESYGGYSGASPREKISWEKLNAGDPTFDIHSDYTIAFPQIAAIVLGK